MTYFAPTPQGEAPNPASLPDARSLEISRRLTRVTMLGAYLILALMLVETWDDPQALGVVLGIQALLVPLNLWLTVRGLPRYGVKRTEMIRAVLNLGSTPLILHFAHWPISVWLWLPYVAMCFDHLGKRAHMLLLLGLAAIMSGTALLDGVPMIIPLASTTFALFCARLSALRVGAIKEMLEHSDEQRWLLAQANDAVWTAHEQLKRETQARCETEAMARDMARQAGRAEMAAGVLHNVGNALNGFTVVSGLLDQDARASKAARLADALRLLRAMDQARDGGLVRHEKGQQLLSYLDKLAEQWRAETEAVLARTRDLQTSAHHISAMVAKQQDYAKPCSVGELCHPSELVRDAVALTASRIRRSIEISESYACADEVVLDRHRVLQIVMNLLRNAEDAVRAQQPAEPRIRVATSCAGGTLRVVVTDNGVGISSDAMGKLFQYGFTTKEQGHGFGLHNARLLADEVGGTISCSSDGEGRGATFTLELPAAPAAAAA